MLSRALDGARKPGFRITVGALTVTLAPVSNVMPVPIVMEVEEMHSQFLLAGNVTFSTMGPEQSGHGVDARVNVLSPP
jgi:hypothetical protein